MIISRRHKFIFLKTSKTAGTSVELALSPLLGPDDIVTPVVTEDEALRKSLGGVGPQNYLTPLSSYSWHDIRKLLLHGQRRKTYYNHINAAEVKALISPHEWDSYYKFSIERNPWDKAISHYHWVYRNSSQPDFDKYTQSRKILRLQRRSAPIYTINGELAVDKLCRYESLEQDLQEVCLHLGLPRLQLPRAKGKYRADRGHYRASIKPQQQHRIADLFAREIELLGYVF